MKYYIKDNQKTYGPADLEKIIARVANHTFSDCALLSKDLRTWVPINQIVQEESAGKNNANPEIYAYSPIPVLHEEHYELQKKKRLYLILGITCGVLLLTLMIVGGIIIYQEVY